MLPIHATELDLNYPKMFRLLTIVIPYYSKKHYLIEAVASVLKQSSPHWNLTVIDDCAPELCSMDEINPNNDPRIRIIRNDHNLGLASNWNKCLDQVSTHKNQELLHIFHSDDLLESNFVEEVLKLKNLYPDSAGIFSYPMVIDATGRKKFFLGDWIKRQSYKKYRPCLMLSGPAGMAAILRNNSIFCPTVVYDMNLVGKERFSNQWNMVTDLEFHLRLLEKGLLLRGFDLGIYRYRRHPQNQSQILTQSLVRSREELALYKNYVQHPNPAVRSAAKRRTMIRLSLIYYALADFLSLNFRSSFQKLTLLMEDLTCPRFKKIL